MGNQPATDVVSFKELNQEATEITKATREFAQSMTKLGKTNIIQSYNFNTRTKYNLRNTTHTHTHIYLPLAFKPRKVSSVVKTAKCLFHLTINLRADLQQDRRDIA